MSGDIWTKYNYEFIQTLYGGTLEIPIMTNITHDLDETKVLGMFYYLKQNNRLLSKLEEPTKR